MKNFLGSEEPIRLFLRSSAKLLAFTLLILLSGCGPYLAKPSDVQPIPHPRREIGSLHFFVPEALDEDRQERDRFAVVAQDRESFAYRLMMVDSAVNTIDIQTYTWKWDQTGKLLFARVLAAADRGVRVRLLIDAVNAGPIASKLAALGQHPMIEPRIYNPPQTWSTPFVQWAEIVFRLPELTHRMHNKLFLADGIIGIAGGRNLGDEYFGEARHYAFFDIDALFSGPVVEDMTQAFEAYWASDRSEWVAVYKDRQEGERSLERLRAELRRYDRENEVLPFRFLHQSEDWQPRKAALRAKLNPAQVKVHVDDPAPEDGSPPVDVGKEMNDLLRTARQEVIIVSPYFLPPQVWYDAVTDLLDRGCRVVVLTNSVSTTDHSVVDANYGQHRDRLLDLGVELYELRDVQRITGPTSKTLTRSATIGVHAKTLLIDRQTAVIGSMNWDPRSLELNTEMAFQIQSPELAHDLYQVLRAAIQPPHAWRVARDDEGNLIWKAGEHTMYPPQPPALIARFKYWVYTALPVEGQL
ncbi:MAG: phospholipase D family protein [Sumerlaeia bacterium]